MLSISSMENRNPLTHYIRNPPPPFETGPEVSTSLYGSDYRIGITYIPYISYISYIHGYLCALVLREELIWGPLEYERLVTCWFGMGACVGR